MTLVLTGEQQAVVGDGLVQQCVMACAGSGKTATAVRRMFEIRRRLGTSRGYVALLSFSNVAVDSFQEQYAALTRNVPALSSRVHISTVDAFLTAHLILPHAKRTMACDRRPFLVRGGEQFLKAHGVWNGEFPQPIEKLTAAITDAGDFSFAVSSNNITTEIDFATADKAIKKLGAVGAFTHALGRYWALLTVLEQERLLQVLARRYPYILIDEAQDLCSLHWTLLSVLSEAGCSLSLIGDPNQAIYEFADADGRFLREFSAEGGVTQHRLSQNRRSVESIVKVADALSGGASLAVREAPTRRHGAFLLSHAEDDPSQAAKAFVAILKDHGYDSSEAAILCRAHTSIEALLGIKENSGQGATSQFAQAAISRDCRADIAEAVQLAVDGTLRLLANTPHGLRQDILSGSREPVAKAIRRAVWRFVRSSSLGLPASSLRAKTEWHPALKSRVPGLLAEIESTCGLVRADKWPLSLKTTDLGDAPLWQGGPISEDVLGVRVATVHKVKGENIGAVLYLATKADIAKLLGGPSTEGGRIGYVAVTRAMDLLVLAIPDSLAPAKRGALEGLGFHAWG